jgi:hypothetical protein
MTGPPLSRRSPAARHLPDEVVAQIVDRADGVIFIKNTSTCLDVRNGVNADRTVVQLWDCDLQARSMRWQFFTLVPDRFFKLISAVGSRCLDVAEGSLQPGAKIQIYRCTQSNTNTAQIWETRAIPGN